eukprot:CAMPEP_0184695314 /NCGR_PEP_ID=MMETSP0313-20130426/2993_1 /TAXON_ID=2792 /ORGANISM="Porphyridium aerugineum, Strain SAG 1380-2" /LENGTH=110 /DNA_ID=CAMNT_0027153749 /DNA_START=156 /DNA_END=488 /DNA_ORIENTATION=+
MAMTIQRSMNMFTRLGANKGLSCLTNPVNANRSQVIMGSRSMASGSDGHDHHDEPKVSWAEYRAGKATYQQWQDANRPTVVGLCLAGYGLIYFLATRGKKKEKKEVAHAH